MSSLGYVFALNITMGLTKEMSSDVKKKQKGCSVVKILVKMSSISFKFK